MKSFGIGLLILGCLVMLGSGVSYMQNNPSKEELSTMEFNQALNNLRASGPNGYGTRDTTNFKQQFAEGRRFAGIFAFVGFVIAGVGISAMFGSPFKTS
ncbi:hypothetical protein [Hydrocarboniphaga effusa]|uniref:hypothetical protein n=1 Tax=Hydrocarboniphaga effusa TaxID=243629 RepID=UPI00398C1E63